MPQKKLVILIVDRAGAQSIWSLMDSIRECAEVSGHVVHTCRWDESDSKEDLFQPTSTDHVVKVPKRKYPWDILVQHVVFYAKFRKLLQRISPDVVHTNFIIPGGFAAFFAKRKGVYKVISSRHELRQSMSLHLRFLSMSSSLYVDHFVHVSKTVGESYTRQPSPIYHAGKPARFLTIYNGIDLDRLKSIFCRKKTKMPHTAVVVGRMVHVKGQSRIIEALSVAQKDDLEFRVIFIGDGPDRSRLESQAEKLGVSALVEFRGWLPRQKTLEEMKAASVVVVPSLQEGFGLVLAEAMILGVPVVASDIPVFREVSQLGSGVALVDSSNPTVLARAVCNTKEISSTLDSSLDKNVMARSYVNLYEATNPSISS